MTDRKKKILLGLSAFHLILVAFGAAQIPLREWGPVGERLDYYGQFSGSSSGYGFFAPGVGTALRGRFEIVDKNGVKFEDTLETGQNREADLRIGNIVGFLSREIEDEKTRRAVGASFAAKMFNRHPQAQQITVNLETLDVPSMKDYAKGVRYEWQSLYRAKFKHMASR